MEVKSIAESQSTFCYVNNRWLDLILTFLKNYYCGMHVHLEIAMLRQSLLRFLFMMNGISVVVISVQ